MKTPVLKVLSLSLVFVAAAMLISCGDEGAEAGVTAAECVDNDLVAQCPPNTVPRLDADSAAECNESGSISVDSIVGSGEGGVSSVCAGTGSCVVVCDLVSPCSCGVERISPEEGVVCSTCAACGNGTCEPGEYPTDCAVDCASECQPFSSRCTSGQLERCTPRGEWEPPVACGEGSSCADNGDGTASCVTDG